MGHHDPSTSKPATEDEDGGVGAGSGDMNTNAAEDAEETVQGAIEEESAGDGSVAGVEGRSGEIPDAADGQEGAEGVDGLEGEVSMEGLDDDDSANEVIMSDPQDGPPHEGKRVKVSHSPSESCCHLTRAFLPNNRPLSSSALHHCLPHLLHFCGSPIGVRAT